MSSDNPSIETRSSSLVSRNLNAGERKRVENKTYKLIAFDTIDMADPASIGAACEIVLDDMIRED